MEIIVHEIHNIGRMVRLHVLNDQVIGLFALERRGDSVEPFVGEFSIDRIQYGCLLI